MKTNLSKTKEEIIEKILCDKYNSFYRLAFSYVHNEADAADIVQEGAYKAIKNSDSLKELDYEGTWVYRIMMNEIFRFMNQKQTVSLDEEDYQEPACEDKYTDVDLQNAMNSMPKEDKMVIELKYFEDMKLEEISKVLDENVSTVKSRLYRALKKLKIVMDV